MAAQMSLQIVHHTIEKFNIAPLFGRFERKRTKGAFGQYHRVGVPPEHVDEKMLQVEADHLLSAKSVRLFCRHILQIGIIQAAVKAASCFDDDIGQDHPFFLIDLKDTVSEKNPWLDPCIQKK
mgnify:CR=1 FL=1